MWTKLCPGIEGYSCIEARQGACSWMVGETPDAGSLARSVERFCEPRVTLPSFTAIADPSSFDHAERVGDADPQGPDARNLWRLHWYNDLAGARVEVPDHVVLGPRADGRREPHQVAR